MGDQEIKEKVSKKRRRNLISKKLRDQGDHKGAFALKVVHPKKGTYKRKKISPYHLEEVIDNEESD